MGAGGEERARRLEAAVGPLLERAAGLSRERLYGTPGGEQWSVMQVLAHVAEMLPYWARQALEVAARERKDQPFGRTHDDPDRVAAVEEHAHDPLDAVLARLRAGLAEAVAALRAIPPEGWERTGRHARRGEMTVAQIVDQFLVEHAEEHARQAEATLAALATR